MNIAKSIFAAAAIFAATAAVAQGGESRTFKHEGVTYTYRVIDKGDAQVIKGKSQLLGETKAFVLTVKNGKVRGLIGGRNVAFATSEARAQNIMLAAD